MELNREFRKKEKQKQRKKEIQENGRECFLVFNIVSHRGNPNQTTLKVESSYWPNQNRLRFKKKIR